MGKVLKQKPTFVNRTYRGGKTLKEFLGLKSAVDGFYPEDWISSFVQAKNKNFVLNEGVSVVETENGDKLITEVVDVNDFGEGRKDSGVLIKFLDAGERLGVQVHPTKEFAKRVFNSDFGKTECWRILDTREINGEKARIYIGFKKGVTKEIWRELYNTQNVAGMLSYMHEFEVEKGDTILVTGGTPHAIGAGCFLLEIQEPSDYTMRCEKALASGEELTPTQIHYGAGEENMLNCFEYIGLTREEALEKYFLKGSNDFIVSYDDTTCFALKKVSSGNILEDCFTTVVAIKGGGVLKYNGKEILLNNGDRMFVSANTPYEIIGGEVLICYPPKI
jgi:mannose-6-phosphate isomerase